MVVWRLLFAQEAVQSLLHRLPPEARARVAMAILGLLLLGGGLVALLIMIGRQFRRRTRLGYRPIQRRPDEWAHKPLVLPPSAEPPQGETQPPPPHDPPSP